MDGFVFGFGDSVDGLQHEGEVLIVLALAVNVVVEVVLFNFVWPLELKTQLFAVNSEDLPLPAAESVPLDVDFDLLVAVQGGVERL